MRCLIPDFILRKTRKKDFKGYFEDAYVLNIDLRGFTNLTHDLMQKSDAGVEVLAEVIDAIFTPAIEAIETRGGFITGFAGDAFTALYPVEDTASVISSALVIRDFFIEKGLHKTGFGDYEVSAKIGIAKGSVNWQIIPDKVQSIYWFWGKGIAQAVQAQKKAEPNRIVITNRVFQKDNKAVKTTKLDTGFSILHQADMLEPFIKTKSSSLSQKGFVPQQILDLRIVGEFRDVLSCFINLKEPQEEQIRTIMSLCSTYGGYFNKVDCTDKGWLALILFGAPTSFEKNSSRAIKFSAELKEIYSTSIRVGMAYGKAYAGFVGSRKRGEYTALGMAVNLGARFMFDAQWGEVLFDRHILYETKHILVYHDMDAKPYKGFMELIPAYRLEGLKETASSSMYHTDFIGRQEELNRLLESCSSVFANKFAGVTYIYGEAGQGKSRLVYELEQALQGKAQFFYLQCDSILKKPLNPFTYWISKQFTKKETGTISERRTDFRKNWAEFTEKVKRLPDTGKTIKEMERIESVIAGLIDLEWEGSVYATLEPKYRPTVTGFALKSILETLCLFRPVVLIIDDLHWIDKESQEIITILTRRAGSIPYKIIFASRPLDDGSKPTIKTDHDVPLNVIDMTGLNQEQTAHLMSKILNNDIETKLVEYAFSISQGNPFTIEQLTRYLLESGQIGFRDEQYLLLEHSKEITAGGQSIIIARLDRLEIELKRTVQIASVLGVEFAVDVLKGILATLGKLPQGINDFVVQSQLYSGEEEHLWKMLSEIRYIFSHSLLREAAYQMQLKKHLQKIHHLAAEVIENLYPEYKSKYEEIAIHYDNAGSWEKAVAYYNKAGKYEKEEFYFDESLNQFNQALKLYQKHRSENDAETANLLNNVGSVYLDKGEYDKALNYYEQSLAIRKEVLGEKHPDTVASLNYIGNVYKDRGEWDKALSYMEPALSLAKEILGERHRDTAASLNNIGLVFNDKGENDKALRYLEQSLAIQKEVLGEKHPETASSLSNTGIVYANKGEYDKALSYFEQALAIKKEVLGEKHPDTAFTLNNIGSFYYKKGDYDKALSYLEQALPIVIEILGERHSDTADSLHEIGSVYYIKGEFDKALSYYEQVLSIVIEILGEKHSDTAGSLNDIGNVYANKGEYNKALNFYEQALAIRKEVLGEKHPDTAGSLNDIGNVYADKGEYDKALNFYEQALAIRKEVLGEKHLDTACSLQEIGAVCAKKGEYDKAISYYEQVLTIRKEVLGEEHPHTLKTINRIADTYKKMADKKKA